jgi:hypothetical protein
MGNLNYIFYELICVIFNNPIIYPYPILPYTYIHYPLSISLALYEILTILLMINPPPMIISFPMHKHYI